MAFGLGIIKGHIATLKHSLRRPITVQYPKQRRKLPERTRGRILWNKEKCTACGICVTTCPINCISLTEYRDEDNKRRPESYQIDFGKCYFCGLCVESCPFKAISMTREFEMADYDRGSLVYSTERMMSPPKED